MLIVLVWQLTFYLQSNKLTSVYTRTDSSGLSYGASKQFLYFFYYLNLYPVVSRVAPTDFSIEGARDLLKNHSKDIYMDYDFMVMWGDNVKNLMYFPDAILNGSAENPSVKTFSVILFVCSLLSILISFYSINKLGLGVMLVLFLGSNPFQLYEVYNNENLFSVHISVLIILLSINLPLFLSIKRPKYYSEIAIIASGIIIGTVASIRVEILALVISCLMIYLLIPRLVLKKKIIFAILFLAIFLLTNQAWIKYFDYKYQQASRVVQSVSGNLLPYANLRTNHHTVWHSVFAGFSDFDTKYGYKWNDLAVYKYAEPILLEQGVTLPKDKEIWSVMPEYQKVIRSKVVHQIKDDPIWYLDIINKRINVLFEKTTPIALNINNYGIEFVIPKVVLIGLMIALIVFLIFSRNYFLLKLLLFSFPPSLVILGIYSAKNVTSISVFQIFSFAIFLYLMLLIIINLGIAVYKKQSLKSVWTALGQIEQFHR